MRCGVVVAALLLAMPVAATPAYAQGEGDEPRDSGITERVGVQLVLLDITVVDKRREIVTGLSVDDFVLRIDSEITPIVSLDSECPDVPVTEPPAVEPDASTGEWQAPDGERRIVFAVDYRHLPQVQRIDVLRQLRSAVDRLHTPREEVMVVALTDFLRVEQPFTSDPTEIVETLKRMEEDISLWLPPFDHLHDGPTFEALLELTELLATLGGNKSVILYSNWPGSSFTYDELYDELASRAAHGRVTFYPVWAKGLQARGTSRPMARLAVETGGRFTERTNDLSLGYARAQRDTSCRYTIGFHDEGVDPQRVRRVDLRLQKRRGVRVYHPDRYALGESEERREAVAAAALAWPGRYTSETLEVALLPIRPLSRNRWEAVMAVQVGEPHPEPVELRARLRRDNTRWRRGAESRPAPFSVSDAYRLRNGTYVTSATASYPGEPQPRAAEHVVKLPKLDEERGWWVGGPLVLRALGGGPVAPEDVEGTALEGDPLGGRVPVLSHAKTADALSMLFNLCRYGSGNDDETVEALLSIKNGERSVFEAPGTLKFRGGIKFGCLGLDEDLPAFPPGNYAAVLNLTFPDGSTEERRHLFEVVVGPAATDQSEPGSSSVIDRSAATSSSSLTAPEGQ